MLVEVRDRIAFVTMNRPDRMNAFGDGLHEALEEFLEMVNYDEAVNAVVLTGAGKAFSAGGDVKAMNDRSSGQTSQRSPMELLRGPKRLVQRFTNCEVPMIAAVNGPAVGLGATCALLCDVIFMADSARIGDRHVNVGITAGDGGSVIWPHLVGPHLAKEMLFTGRLLNGEEAARIGLVNHCVPADRLMEEATAYAREVADGATLAIRYTKISINKMIWHSVNQIMDFSLLSEYVCMNTEDHKEATAAFREKRKPSFVGR
ncbi:MAG: enoyl-CoA hydratase/isomerase family protein [Gammaproteobacteria bacterium]|nr:enoyl-CoA hydratase/isomerase family protein [Gammaproteobacteria bacterium]